MDGSDLSVYEVLAVLSISGFAVQQLLQILDPVIVAALARIKGIKALKISAMLGSVTDESLKKSVMYLLSTLLGLVIVSFTGMQLLSYVRPEWGGNLADVLISALVVGSGTEGVNTFLKLLGYLKDNQNPAYKFLDTSVSVTPGETTVRVENTAHFLAIVLNATPNTVRREVVQGNSGGTIDAQGLYTAPANAGTYQVRAISNADPAKTGLATVHVVN